MGKAYFKHPLRAFGWVLAGLLLLLIALEGWRYGVKPEPGQMAGQAAHTTKVAARQFSKQQKKLLQRAQTLAVTIQTELEQTQNRSELFQTLETYPGLWGAALYQANEPVVWNGFSLDILSDIQGINRQSDSYVRVHQVGNVLLWIAHVAFRVSTKSGPVPYHLYVLKRIRQVNFLPIGREQEVNLTGSAQSANSKSTDITIYEKMPPAVQHYRVLRALSGDSVGVVYSTSVNLKKASQNWKHTTRFWRALFVLFCFVVLGAMFYFWAEEWSLWKGLLFQLFIIITGWIVFHQINIAETWLPQLLSGVRPERLHSYQLMSNFGVDGLFFLFTALTLRRKLFILQFRQKIRSFFAALFMAVANGCLQVVGILYSIKACYHLVYQTDLSLLNLQVIPGIDVLLLYFCLGLVLYALTIGLFSVNHFLLRSCERFIKLASIISILSFLGSLFIAQLFISNILAINWIFTISTVYFGLIFFLSFRYYRISFSLPYHSALRNAAIYSLLISLLGSTVIYQAGKQKTDAKLRETVQRYTHNNNKEAEDLTRQILSTLQHKFESLSQADLNHRISFLQSRFTSAIDSAITPKMRVYSFDLQLVDAQKHLLANYSTNLNSPEWTETFDLQRLQSVMNIEQISKLTVRPIVQKPSLENADRYRTFYRGWLPIFGANPYQPIAWILCSVYRVRPNYDKPIRAVMASLHFYNWQTSYLIQQYRHNRLTQTTYRGQKLYYPIYNVLQEGEQKALQQDSTLFYSSKNDGNTFRNLLVKTSPEIVLKSTTMLPGYQNILFSFFRLSFVLLIAGFILLLIQQFIQTRSITLFENNERFQYRILDSFLLAALVFLIFLVIVTHYAIKQQNKEAVKQQLVQKLDPITRAIEADTHVKRQSATTSMATLNSLTTTLNIDASIYKGPLLAKSTTPQIYRQHLLPATLSYPVYSDLYLYQKRNSLTKVTLNGQELLIGYRSVLSKSGAPIAAVAIPTFVQSPQFNKQLLQTTSYLIILYLVVFGIFIIGTIFISRELTRPLYHIQQGLNKISQGDLNTTIPVSRNDEIGGLAMAYNTMVVRLQELQKELAATEREAAWQEMAQQVAHEIKNPLTPMKLSIQHLERQLTSDNFNVDELKDKVNKITKNLILQIQSLNHIASDFKKFSKPINEQDFGEVEINELIDSVVQLYQQDERGIRRKLNASESRVSGIEEDLRRVIVNLLKNAQEATRDGQAISIKTYVREQSIFMEIADSGQGIKEEDKPKIFVPNFSTKSGGTGLGLAICKKVVEQHHGNISFASIQGKGTTFIVKLPLAKS